MDADKMVLDASVVSVAVVAVHHLGHFFVHFPLQFLHISAFCIALQLRKHDLGLRLRLAGLREDLCLDVLFELALEVVVILHLQAEVIALVVLYGLRRTLGAPRVLNRLDGFAVGGLLRQYCFGSGRGRLLGLSLRELLREGRFGRMLDAVGYFFVEEGLELLFAMHAVLFSADCTI